MQKRVECECGWSLQTEDEAKLVAGVQQVLAQARPA
jgi:hypothetical protein